MAWSDPDVERLWRRRYMQRTRAERRAKGLCRDCPQPARPGRATCAYHAALDGQRARRSESQERRRARFKALGLCAQCGKVPVCKFAECFRCRVRRSCNTSAA